MDNKIIPIRPDLPIKEYKPVRVLQLECIRELERERAAERESIIYNLIGMASLISIIFILANLISNH
jgi:hypothetical protein